MTLSTILTLIFAHWHKVVAVVALFAALYTKFSKNKTLDILIKRIDQMENTPQKIKAVKKSPRKKKA